MHQTNSAPKLPSFSVYLKAKGIFIIAGNRFRHEREKLIHIKLSFCKKSVFAKTLSVYEKEQKSFVFPVCMSLCADKWTIHWCDHWHNGQSVQLHPDCVGLILLPCCRLKGTTFICCSWCCRHVTDTAVTKRQRVRLDPSTVRVTCRRVSWSLRFLIGCLLKTIQYFCGGKRSTGRWWFEPTPTVTQHCSFALWVTGQQWVFVQRPWVGAAGLRGWGFVHQCRIISWLWKKEAAV